MSDIVTRLRNWRDVHLARLHILMDEAANLIELLKAVNAASHSGFMVLAGVVDGMSGEIKRLRLLSGSGDCPASDNAANADILTEDEREAVEVACQDLRHTEEVAILRGLLARLGGCTPQLDCGVDRKSVASERCRDTGGRPFDSAPITLTDEEREAVAYYIGTGGPDGVDSVLVSLLKRL